MAFFELQLELFRRAHRPYRRRAFTALREQVRGTFLAKHRGVIACARAPVPDFMLLLQQCREHGLVARGVKLPFQLVRELEVAPTRKVRSGGAQEEGSAAHAARHIRVRSNRVGLPVARRWAPRRVGGVQLGWEGQRAARVPALHALVVVPRARGADFVAPRWQIRGRAYRRQAAVSAAPPMAGSARHPARVPADYGSRAISCLGVLDAAAAPEPSSQDQLDRRIDALCDAVQLYGQRG